MLAMEGIGLKVCSHVAVSTAQFDTRCQLFSVYLWNRSHLEAAVWKPQQLTGGSRRTETNGIVQTQR